MTQLVERMSAWMFADENGSMYYHEPGPGLVLQAKRLPLAPYIEQPARRPQTNQGYGIPVCKRPLYALQLGGTPTVCFGRITGDTLEHGYITYTSEFEMQTVMDATPALQAFARWCARQVADIWPFPDAVKAYIVQGVASYRGHSWNEAQRASHQMQAPGNQIPWSMIHTARCAMYASEVEGHGLSVMEATKRAYQAMLDARTCYWTELAWPEGYVQVSMADLVTAANEHLESELNRLMFGI